ncbi:Protein CobW [Erysiphe neolycopersici]|uniref:Protein CobW n=1 Tax=Erysiphe neolycopersici TaxID=212602 RepID=A0A420I1L5_9PEZI|nr:Protein CobW [Erysiphe neolycopersici]
MSSAIPVTIITGFLGSGKTTLIINLLAQLRATDPNYKVALLKNEYGDLAIDSQLTALYSSTLGVREILNGCICCSMVGSVESSLEELTNYLSPNRIVIETSGSAFPAILAMEVNRLARETNGKYVLDGVITVIDVENWKGYEDTSYTSRVQARYTDLIIFNKWEDVDERRWDECLDRLGDMGIEVPWVKSNKGWVDMNVMFGVDRALARRLEICLESESNSQHKHDREHNKGHDNDHKHEHEHMHNEGENHQSEVEVLSVTLSLNRPTKSNSCLTPTTTSPVLSPKLDVNAFLGFLKTAPRDEIYRMKAIVTSSSPIPSSDPSETPASLSSNQSRYILNWAFGRWTCTPFDAPESQPNKGVTEHPSSKHVGQGEIFLRMVVILSRGESKKWKRKIEDGKLIRFDVKTLECCTEKLTVVSII